MSSLKGGGRIATGSGAANTEQQGAQAKERRKPKRINRFPTADDRLEVLSILLVEDVAFNQMIAQLLLEQHR